MLKSLALKILILILIVVCYGCKVKPKPSSVHLTLGNPSGATTNNVDNYLMVLPQYALSYNCTKGTPNWVSWQLDKSWLGSVKRRDEFKANDALPEGCYRVQPKDYLGTGYDRGHMTPSGDRTQSVEDNQATFFMTNIIPQSPANNREVWRILEEYCRELALQGKQLYIIAGPEGKKGTIAEGKVAIPRYTWKIVVIVDKPGQEITPTSKVIAVKVANSQKVEKTTWQQYLVSIADLEAETGYDFLSYVSENTQKILENKVNN